MADCLWLTILDAETYLCDANPASCLDSRNAPSSCQGHPPQENQSRIFPHRPLLSILDSNTQPSMMKAKPHIAVIGAGAFGSWTALHLLERGARVTLLDAWGPGNSRASSGGETRIMRATYGLDQRYTATAARALKLWHRCWRLRSRRIWCRWRLRIGPEQSAMPRWS